MAGTYLNIRLKPTALFSAAFIAATDKDAIINLGSDRIMVEFLSPNTNKPLHLGHLRNGATGSAVSNILEAVGHSVIRANLVNDRGIHICKSMLAWQLFGNGATPESTGMKGDHFVGDWYVRFSQEVKNNTSLNVQAEDMLLKWEAGDPEVLGLWAEMNNWVYKGFGQTYSRFGFHFAKQYYESELYMLGKDIVQAGLEKGIFRHTEEGAVVFPLDPKKFGMNADGSEKLATLLRKDGTSIYLTQDLGTAVMKVEDFNADRSIYVVACEQQHHFQVLFAILQALGYQWAPNCYHLSYQMVNLPDGKMKSREGTVIDADDLANEMATMANEAIRQKHSGEELTEEEVVVRAEKIALAAIKFYLLRFDPQTTIRFDPKKSLSFEGDTGPYCLYAYTRIQSILQRAKLQGLNPDSGNFNRLGEAEERIIALNLISLPVTIQRAAASYNPAMLAGYVLELAHSFNAFYAKHQVISEDRQLAQQRLGLISAVAEGLRWGLSLLGIETLDAM